MHDTDAKWYIRKRYYVTLMTGCGCFLAVALRSNLGIAIVHMTSNKNVTNENGTYFEKPEFNWNSMEKGLVLSSFSWGFLISPVGGILTNKMGGSVIYGLGLVTTALLTILSPFLLRLSTTAFIGVRILEGITEGFAFAGIMEICLYWSPPNERSRLLCILCIGTHFAPALAYPACGYISELYGWEAMFFVSGSIVVLWYIIWLASVTNTPSSDKFISAVERQYLTENIIVPENVEIKNPWMAVLKSKAVWVFLNQRFVDAWSLSFLIQCLPLFIKDIQKGNISEIGLSSGIPHVSVLLGLGISSFLSDYLRKIKFLSISNIHKIFIGGGDILCTVSLIAMIMWMDLTGVIVCLSVFKFFNSFVMTSCAVLALDIGQRYSSFLSGVAVTVIGIGYILNPIFMGLIVQNHTIDEWKTYLIFLCSFSFYGSLVFLLYGSAELQSWARTDIATVQKEVKGPNGFKVK